jgi:hypothetical protein
MSWGCDDFVSILAHSPLAGRDRVGMRTHPMDVMLSSAKHLAFSGRYKDEILRLRLRMTLQHGQTSVEDIRRR